MKRQFQEYITQYHILLLALLMFHMINNYFWLKKDTFPLGWDPGLHFLNSLRIFDILKHPSLNIFSEIAKVSSYYPPLVYLIPAPFYAIFGRAPDIAVFTMNSVFLVVLISSVYGIGSKLYSKKAGLLASFIVTMYPIIFGQIRSFMLDVPLAAITALSVYTLLKTDNFKNRKNSLLFGLTLGLGMLTKWTFVVFISGPLLYALYTSFIKERNTEAQNTLYLNFGVSFLLGLAVMSIWYLPNFAAYTTKLGSSAFGEPALRDNIPVFSGTSALFYLFSLINKQISLIFFLIFITGLYLSVKSGNRESLVPLMAWIFMPYLILTLLPHKVDRYTMPYLPAVALLSGIGILQTNNKKIKSIAVSLIIFVGIFQFFSVSYGMKSLPMYKGIDVPYGKVVLFGKGFQWSPYPRSQDWKTEEILSAIFTSEREDRILKIMVIPTDARLIPPMKYLSYLKGRYHVLIFDGIQTSRVYDSSYVLTKTRGYMGESFYLNRINKTAEIFNEMKNYSKLIAEIELPDSKLLVYKKKSYELMRFDIDIGRGDSGFIGGGFYKAERHPDNTTYRWTGKTAILEIPLPQNVTVFKMLLTLRVESMRPEDVAPAVASIVVNGYEFANSTIGRKGIHKFIIPPRYLDSDRLNVEIRSTTWNPSLYGNTSDSRELGIVLDWVSLECQCARKNR